MEATNSVINRQDGKVVLVGHSWGGTVITAAGVNDKVAALVYVAAFMPAEGETTGKWVAAAPASPEAGFTAPDQFGYVYFDPAKFHSGFAADLSKVQSDLMNASQVPIIGKCFEEPVEHAAWKSKPSYGIIASQDKALNPATERAMYERAKEGKVKHIGVSEINAEQLRQANAVYPISALEIGYSLADRQIERELLPAAKELGISVVAFANTAEGLLTGDMKAPLAENDYHAHFSRFQGDNLIKNLEKVEVLKQLAVEKGATGHNWRLPG